MDTINNKLTHAADWIARLGLELHPEGGWFKECYQAPASYGKSDDGGDAGT